MILDSLFILLVILIVPLEAYHDWHRQYKVNAGTIYNNHQDRRSKRTKGILLASAWLIGIYYPCLRELTLVHIGARMLMFDFFCEYYRFDGDSFKQIFYNVWLNLEIKKQWLEFKRLFLRRR